MMAKTASNQENQAPDATTPTKTMIVPKLVGETRMTRSKSLSDQKQLEKKSDSPKTKPGGSRPRRVQSLPCSFCKRQFRNARLLGLHALVCPQKSILSDFDAAPKKKDNGQPKPVKARRSLPANLPIEKQASLGKKTRGRPKKVANAAIHPLLARLPVTVTTTAATTKPEKRASNEIEILRPKTAKARRLDEIRKSLGNSNNVTITSTAKEDKTDDDPDCIVIEETFSLAVALNPTAASSIKCPFCCKDFETKADLTNHPIYCNKMKAYEQSKTCEFCKIALPVSLCGLHEMFCQLNVRRIPLSKENIERNIEVVCSQCQGTFDLDNLPRHLAHCLPMVQSILSNASKNGDFKWSASKSEDYIAKAGLAALLR